MAGKKAGPKQGEIGGILKELGYNEDQVRIFLLQNLHLVSTEQSNVIQVFKF